jgi:diguanylate cyclase
MNKTSEAPDSYWKEKCRDLQTRDAEQAEKEQLLSRAIIRLTFAASGLDPALDPHLQSIREVVKRDLKTADLRQEMDALMDTLIRIPPSDSRENAQTAGRELLRFLQSQCITRDAQAALADLQKRIEVNEFATEGQLFNAVAQLLPQTPATEVPTAERKGLLGKWLHKDEPASRTPETNLRERLENLLKALNTPTAMRKRMERLLLKLKSDQERLIPLLDEASTLIAEIGAEQRKEESKLHDFLTGLSTKLDELEKRTLGIDGLHRESADSRRKSDESVGSEMSRLRQDANDATDLLQLKRTISTRVDFIAAQLNSSRAAEEARVAEIQKQMQALAQKTRALEQETDDLRAKLVIAHDYAFIDPLTKLPNRAAYMQRIELEEKRWKRFRQPLSLAVWDIDFFKQVNDRFGHASGDRALSLIGRILVSSVRETDFVARYGGEEFVMLLANADEECAVLATEEIRKRIEESEFSAQGKRVPITVSCGISQFKGMDAWGDVFERADQALYQAKRKGRNRCEIAPSNR